jgi:hypothetical protein
VLSVIDAFLFESLISSYENQERALIDQAKGRPYGNDDDILIFGSTPLVFLTTGLIIARRRDKCRLLRTFQNTITFIMMYAVLPYFHTKSGFSDSLNESKA